MSELEQKELEHYKRKFSLAEHDLAISGYLAYVGVVEQQIEYIKNFKLSGNIDGKKADTVIYERSIALWESLPEAISKMNKLKFELKIEFDPEEGKVKQQATRPELMVKKN
jgi:hypothetical protein